MRLSICIATCRNPAGLKKLLASIVKQEPWNHNLINLQVNVVDNDPNESARDLVESLRREFPYPLHYQCETKAGIPFARNRTVQMARGSDCIVFVDDDEFASAGWLRSLLATQLETNADIVTGPVIPCFDISPPTWDKDGELYSVKRAHTGTPTTTFYTNNTLILSKCLSKIPGPFDESMSLTGGTDSLLASQLLAKGARCVWCDEAVVYEDIPASRTRLWWYLMRRLRIGRASVLVRRRISGGAALGWCAGRVFRFIPLGLYACVQSLWKGRPRGIRGLGYLWTASGIIGEVLGLSKDEYNKQDYRSSST